MTQTPPPLATVTVVGLDPAKPAAPAPADAKPVVAEDGSITVVDAGGRRIVVKRLTPVETYRMMKVTKATGDEGFFGMACMAAAVRSLGGEGCLLPHSEMTIEAMLQRLGADGLAAVGVAMGAGSEDAENTGAPKA